MQMLQTLVLRSERWRAYCSGASESGSSACKTTPKRRAAATWPLQYSRSLSGRLPLRLEYLLSTGLQEQVRQLGSVCWLVIKDLCVVAASVPTQKLLKFRGAQQQQLTQLLLRCCLATPLLLCRALVQVSLTHADKATEEAWASQFPDFQDWVGLRLHHLQQDAASEWPPVLLEKAVNWHAAWISGQKWGSRKAGARQAAGASQVSRPAAAARAAAAAERSRAEADRTGQDGTTGAAATVRTGRRRRHTAQPQEL